MNLSMAASRRALYAIANLALLGLAVSLMAGCSGSALLEPRDGYIVSHQYVAPSHSSRVRHLVLHYTDEDQSRSLEVLTGPLVSAHYLLPEPARFSHGRPLVYQLADESRRAWHAGASAWKGRTNINDTSIGIEIVNDGPDLSSLAAQWQLNGELETDIEIHWAPYPEKQIETLINLAHDIIERHDIAATDIVAHADIAPSRKIDPGPRFPWKQLHEAGIGAWPDAAAVSRYQNRFRLTPPTLAMLQRALSEYGYPIEVSGQLDKQTRDVLRAFQMHFRPSDYRGFPDTETAAILWALLERYRPEVLEQTN